MNTLVVVAALLTVCSCHVLTDSSYVEGDSRDVWTSDPDGPPAVDLEEPVDEELLKTRPGANNQYFLYTRRNPHNPQVIDHADNDGLRESNYNPRLNLNVIVHGWNQDGNSEINTLLRTAFLSRQDCNVIIVDWSALANTNYATATVGVASVGYYLGIYLLWLMNMTAGNWNQVHLIGAGLGAHVVGIAGRHTGRRPARITGLDPAGPGWHGHPDRLSSNSGQYVEAIHTDGHGIGIFVPSGDADFYVNGGWHPQPGCLTNPCSHNMAVELFAMSINLVINGVECFDQGQISISNCTGGLFPMGNDDVDKRGSGIYLVRGIRYPYNYGLDDK